MQHVIRQVSSFVEQFVVGVIIQFIKRCQVGRAIPVAAGTVDHRVSFYLFCIFRFYRCFRHCFLANFSNGHTSNVLIHSFMMRSRLVRQYKLLAGKEYISFCKNRALVDNFFKLCMMLCMDMTFSKTTAYKSGETPSGCYPQNPRWPPLETEKAISRLISTLQPLVIPVFLYF